MGIYLHGRLLEPAQWSRVPASIQTSLDKMCPRSVLASMWHKTIRGSL
jgi:hypothetical protein